MDDALRKAAEERERKRRSRGRHPDATPTNAPSAPLDSAPSEPAGIDEQGVDSPPAEKVSSGQSTSTDSPFPSDVAEPAAPADSRPSDEAATPTSARRSVAGRARAKAARERVREEVEAASLTTDERGSDGVDPRVISYHEPGDPRAEQMRGLRTTLLTMDLQPRSVAVTSGSSNEGKSLACANLAASLVEGGSRRVLLVDANLRHPQLCDLVAARDGAGLSDLMAGGASDPRALIQQTGIPNVDLLPAGQSLDNPGSLLNPKALAGVLGLVEDDYDFVIVDTPALDEYADAAVLAPEVDGAILVCQIEGPPRSAAEKALDLLESARARVLGLMATNCR